MSLQELPNNYGFANGDTSFLREHYQFVIEQLDKERYHDFITITHCTHCQLTSFFETTYFQPVGDYLPCWMCGHRLRQIMVNLTKYKDAPPNLDDIDKMILPHGFNHITGDHDFFEQNFHHTLADLGMGWIHMRGNNYCVLAFCTNCQRSTSLIYDKKPELDSWIECATCEQKTTQIKTIIDKSETPEKIKEPCGTRTRRDCDQCGKVYQCTINDGIPAFLICLFCRRKNK